MWSDSRANQQTIYPHFHIALKVIKNLFFSHSLYGYSGSLRSNEPYHLCNDCRVCVIVHERQDICQEPPSAIDRQAMP